MPVFEGADVGIGEPLHDPLGEAGLSCLGGHLHERRRDPFHLRADVRPGSLPSLVEQPGRLLDAAVDRLGDGRLPEREGIAGERCRKLQI